MHIAIFFYHILFLLDCTLHIAFKCIAFIFCPFSTLSRTLTETTFDFQYCTQAVCCCRSYCYRYYRCDTITCSCVIVASVAVVHCNYSLGGGVCSSGSVVILDIFLIFIVANGNGQSNGSHQPFSLAANNFRTILQQQLNDIHAAGTYKYERVITTPQKSVINIEDSSKPLINFCANNYLGMAVSIVSTFLTFFFPLDLWSRHISRIFLFHVT